MQIVYRAIEKLDDNTRVILSDISHLSAPAVRVHRELKPKDVVLGVPLRRLRLTLSLVLSVLSGKLLSLCAPARLSVKLMTLTLAGD